MLASLRRDSGQSFQLAGAPRDIYQPAASGATPHTHSASEEREESISSVTRCGCSLERYQAERSPSKPGKKFGGKIPSLDRADSKEEQTNNISDYLEIDFIPWAGGDSGT